MNNFLLVVLYIILTCYSKEHETDIIYWSTTGQQRNDGSDKGHQICDETSRVVVATREHIRYA
jgi:hypothetical protein